MNPAMRARLQEKFRSISRERMQRLTDNYIQYEADGDEAALEIVLRELHSLKGESRMMGFLPINALIHRCEDHLHAVRRGELKGERAFHDAVLKTFDVVNELIDEDPETDKVDVEAVVAALDAAVGGGGAPAPAATPPPPVPAPQPDPIPSPTPQEPDQPSEAPTKRREDQFVRVERDRLARITELAAETMLGRGRVEGFFSRIREQMEQLEAQIQATQRRVKDESLQTLLEQAKTVRRLSIGGADEVFDQRVRMEELDDVVRSLRLVQIETLFAQFRRATRDIAKEQGKDVTVVLNGGTVEIDKDILDELGEPLLHLVRNAVDHGLESPTERLAIGKPGKATLTLDARQLGGKVTITVRDDGRGIDPDRLRDAAVRRGVLTRTDADRLDDSDALGLIYRSGLSSREEVSDLSGRGVGMAVVRERVHAVGGTVEVESTLGEGTAFHLHVPVSMVLQRVMLIRQAGAPFALPMDLVRTAEVINPDQVEMVGRARVLDIDGERTAYVELAALLGQAPQPAVAGQPILVVEVGRRRLVLAVDDFAGVETAVHRPLDEVLAGLRLYQGAIAMPNGELALLLDIDQVIAEASGEKRIITAVDAAPLPTGKTADNVPLVLVVDDSEFTRDMVVGVVQRGGYRVVDAVNGQQGLERFEANEVDLVLTDLDMPVMDGFGLLLELRRHARGKDVPVIVFSTRGSDDDKRRASRLGADAYLVKSEFREEDMHATLRRFLDS